MLARIRKAQEEEGFTLIELLVVIIIIGILAAIAIPVFLNQRQKGYDAAIKSDLRNAATAEETYLTDNNSYSAQTPVGSDLTTLGFKYSGTTNYSGGTQSIAVKVTGGNGSYCLKATSASSKVFYYDSATGGLTTTPTAANCP
jgi:type IV pilus assembly protein PilA